MTNCCLGRMRRRVNSRVFDPFDEWLDSQGLYRKQVARDGSCLFRAVAEQVIPSVCMWWLSSVCVFFYLYLWNCASIGRKEQEEVK